MRTVLATVPMSGVIVIGEGEKDEAPMLFNGEKVGDGSNPQTDVAVDPIDGTTLTANGRGNALSVIAVSEKGTMFDPGPCMYMEKIAVGPDVKGCIDINASYTDNLKWIARAKSENVRDLTVMILDRPRHDELIKEVRATGARIKLISDGDIFGAIATAWPDAGVDVLFGIGGTPEGVTSAAALKCMNGEIQGKLWPRNEQERIAALEAGYDLDLGPVFIGLDASATPMGESGQHIDRVFVTMKPDTEREHSRERWSAGATACIGAKAGAFYIYGKGGLALSRKQYELTGYSHPTWSSPDWQAPAPAG
jgi:hypothetical protein